MSALEHYISLGLHLVPWLNRSAPQRKPIWKGWNHETQPTEASIRQAISEYPKADWAVVPKEWFLAVDLDRKNGVDGIATFSKWCADNGSSFQEILNTCPNVKTFSNGLHIYFGFRGEGKSRILSPGVEVKYRTASVHIPPSEGYSWNVPLVKELPPAPAWLVEMWEEAQAGYEKDSVVEKKKFVNGERHHSLCAMAGVLRNSGLVGVELRDALRAVAANRCEGDFPLEEVDKIAEDYSNRSGFNLIESALNGDTCAASVLRLAAKSVPERIVVEPTPKEDDASEVTVLSHAELHPTEMIGSLVDWADACNWTHQPELTLLGISTAIALMINRRYRIDSLYPNLYSLALVESGCGKENIKRAVHKLLYDTGFEDCVGGGSFGSDSGLITELRTRPCIIWVTDEMQGFIQNASNPKAASYMVNIESMLLEIYTCGDYRVKSLKNAEGEILKSLYPNILGMSQPGRFWKAFNERFIESGFIGRFVVFNGRPFPRLDEGAKVLEDCPVPENVVNMLKPYLATKNLVLTNRTHSENVTRIEFENEDAKELNSKLLDEWQDTRQEYAKRGDNSLCTIMGRDYEKAKRFMAIHAFSENPLAPKIGRRAIEWGWAIVRHADNCVKFGLTHKYSVNDDEAMLNRFYKVIEGCGSVGVDGSTLRIKTQWAHKTRDKLIDELVGSNKIVIRLLKGQAGRPKRIIYASKYAPQEVEDATSR